MVKDYLGNKFKTVKAMCDYYKIDRRTYISRLETGMTMEQALTTPVKIKTSISRLGKRCTDHKGNSYNSIAEMCKHYNVTVSAYEMRIFRGIPLCDALELTTDEIRKLYTHGTRERGSDNKTGCTDHLGNKYNSTTDMCRAYNISLTTYKARLNQGKTLKEALTKPCNKCKPCKDHRGTEYNSIGEMCKAYNIESSVFTNRLRRGMTLEQALTTPKRKNNDNQRHDNTQIGDSIYYNEENLI